MGQSDEGFRVNRRTVLAAAGVSTLVGVTRSLFAVQRRPPTDGEAWVEAHAVGIRTVDPSDEDFRDLEPIANAIGSARVVQLGEPSHGAGTAFAAKARLIKFLHRHMGFDVLIWESGLYDVELAQAGMRGTDDALTAARRGLFSLWSESAEARAVFEYVKGSQATTRPIDMAGFDMQITADGSAERYAPELRAFASALRTVELREQALMLATRATNARRQLFSTKFAARGDLDDLASAAHRLRTLIRVRRTDFEQAWGSLHTTLMDRTIQNMLVDAAQRFDAAQSPPTTPERENRRDALNADNLLWLIETRYAGRKAVVWAHNVHVMHAFYSPDFRALHLKPGPRDMKPTGVFLAEKLGKNLYTIGMTAFEGSEGLAIGGLRTPIPPAPDGDLEASLHALGHPYAFLDLRTCPALTARMPKFESVSISDPSRVYDGLFFIDRMMAATHV